MLRGTPFYTIVIFIVFSATDKWTGDVTRWSRKVCCNRSHAALPRWEGLEVLLSAQVRSWTWGDSLGSKYTVLTIFGQSTQEVSLGF